MNNTKLEIETTLINSIDAEQSELKISDQKKKGIDALYIEVDLLKKRIEKQEKRLQSVDMTNFKQMELRHSDLAILFQRLMERITICSEVAAYVRTRKNLNSNDRADLLDASIMIYDVYDDTIIRMLAGMPLKKVVQYLADNHKKIKEKFMDLAA